MRLYHLVNDNENYLIATFKTMNEAFEILNYLVLNHGYKKDSLAVEPGWLDTVDSYKEHNNKRGE